MKKFLTAITVLLTIISINNSIAAQRIEISQPTVKFNKNPVRYADLKAFTDGRGVWLEWTTSSESKNLGFYVYRVIGGERELVSPSFIPGAYLKTREETTTSGTYSFFDRNGDAGSVYTIESYNVSGQRNYSSSFQVVIIPDLTAVAGVSSAQLQNQAEQSRQEVSGSDSTLPDDLAKEVAGDSIAPNPVTQRWIAAQGGARILIKNEGFYRVSRSELQTAGFDVNAPVARWQLYLNGVEQAVNIGGNGDYIEFYGKGINTLYAESQPYFLVVGTSNGKRIGTTTRRRVGGSVASNSYLQTFYTKDIGTYLGDILNGDVENFFGGTIINAAGGTVNFNLSGVDFSASTASIDLTIQGLTYVTHQTRVLLNNTEIGNLSGEGRDAMSGTFTFSTALLREGANTLKMASLNSVPGGPSDVSLTNFMKVNFARRYLANQNRLSFYVPNYRNSYAENFSSANIRVFDLTNPDTPTLITGLAVEPSNGGFRVNLPSNRGRVLFALEDTAVSTPVSVTQNMPSTLSTTTHNSEFVIISHRSLRTSADTWLDYRRSQGFSGEVVDIEDIYDEFNYGVLGADCIRDFLSYAKNNWQTPPRYVLIIGDATYDPKGYFSNTAAGNLVPTRLVDTVYSEVGSDDTLADFNNDGLAEIAIGRIPARDNAFVNLALSKVTTFEQTVGQGLSRGVLFASDLPNGYDFEGASVRLGNQLPSSVPKTFVNRGQTDSTNILMGHLNAGKFMVNYAGHGNVGVWEGGFFDNAKASQMTNGNNLTIFTMLTCLNGYFIQPPDSLSEFLLKNPNGGAVAVWASSGLTTPDIQEIMGTRFYNQVGAGNITRLGDLVNDAKTAINFGRDVRLSWVLLGDPMMKVR